MAMNTGILLGFQVRLLAKIAKLRRFELTLFKRLAG